MNKETKILVPVPTKYELICLCVNIDPNAIKDSSAKSMFHWQTMICKLIITAFSTNLMACPVYDTDGLIYVITTNEFYQTGKLQRKLNTINLKHILQPSLVPNNMYLCCLKFTIMCQMAPEWIKVGKYLVNGRISRSTNAQLTAVTLNLNFEGELLNLKILPRKVHLPHVKTEDLPIVGSEDDDIRELPYHTWISVLPSMKRGSLLSVSRNIPKFSVFQNYGQIRRHWKNMYGYQLPTTDDGISYYQIKFPVPKSEIFTYPDLCVLSCAPKPSSVNNYEGEMIINQFVCQLQKVLPNICGKPFKIFNDDESTNFNFTSAYDTLSCTTISSYSTPSQSVEKSLKTLQPNVAKLEFTGGFTHYLRNTVQPHVEYGSERITLPNNDLSEETDTESFHLLSILRPTAKDCENTQAPAKNGRNAILQQLASVETSTSTIQTPKKDVTNKRKSSDTHDNRYTCSPYFKKSRLSSKDQDLHDKIQACSSISEKLSLLRQSNSAQE